MTFFEKHKDPRLFDQQAVNRLDSLKKDKRKRLTLLLLRAFLVVIFIIVLLNIISRAPEFFTKVAKPFPNLQSEFYNNNDLSFDKRTNLLLLTVRDQQLQELALASVETGKKKIFVLKLPPENTVFSSSGLRKIQDLVIYESGSVKSIDQLSAAAMELFGYIPDGYLLVTDASNWIEEGTLNSLVVETSFSPGKVLSARETKNFLDKHLVTNLTINQLYELSSVARAIPPERFTIVDLADYSNAGFVDQIALWNEVGVQLNDRTVVDGNYSVNITNASGVEGMGLVLKNIASNLGANVVQVNSAEVVLEESEVRTKQKNNYLTQRLINLLDAEFKEEQSGSVDLEIIIGSEFGKLFEY